MWYSIKIKIKFFMNKFRVRFAPSPTGFLHVGGLRSALYNYLFARQNNGTFILRIEDTDKNRFVKNAVENIVKSLEWAGFVWDEGVIINQKSKCKNQNVSESKNYKGIVEVGDYGPYIQSERLDIYKKYAEELMKKGKAYYCFCPSEKLEKMRNEQMARKEAPMYDRCCLKLSPEETKKKLKSGEKYVIRQKINAEGVTEFDDMIRGKVKFENKLLDDQVLLKSDGYPTYNFANVIDDHLMEISHIIRGEEFISSTPKFIQLYDNFGWDKPKFAHLPLLLNIDRTKLSKRQGDVAVKDYIKKGYFKDAIVNFAALLGWNPGEGSTQEIFSMEELIEKFDLEKVHQAGAVFDLQKLDWLNSQYIKKLSIDELYKLSKEFFEQKDFYNNAGKEKKSEEYLKKVLIIEQERLKNLSGVGESDKFFFQDINCDKELLRWKNMSDNELKNNFRKAKIILENISDADWTKENLEKILLKEAGDKRGEFLWPLRAALTGEQKSPPPFEVAWVLGKNYSIERINKALKLL